ncbi:MAG: histidine kinase dimerization/phosphoacceptor domain -containing protein [bacterium]
MSLTERIKKDLFGEIKTLSSRIAWKAAFLSWLLIVITIILFVVFTLPYIKSSAVERMQNEAADITTSIIHANASALITEEYSYVVDHCFNLVRESNSILYVVIVRNNGFSLIHYKDKWEIDSLDHTTVQEFIQPEGQIKISPLLGKEVFHKSHNFIYSGIDWGWIHVGLSLENYNKSNSETTLRITWLTIILSIIGFIFSIFFARTLTKPITILDRAARKIASGNLEVKAEIYTGDELESLANSFNTMAEAVRISHTELEARVLDRTVDLAKANESLISEVQYRKAAEKSLHEYNIKVNTFRNIYKGLIEAKTTKEILISTVNQLHGILINFDLCSIFLFSNENNMAKYYEVKFTGNEFEFEIQNIPLVNFQFHNNSSQNEFHIVHDLAAVKDKSEIERHILRKGFKSCINSSLMFRGELIGELNLSSRNASSFSDHDKEIMVELRHPLSMAISQLILQEDLKKQADVLQSSLKEKEILLKEIHHRVKNNLQIISSLLYLQSSKAENISFINQLTDSQNRVKTMALIHEKLYQSRNLSKINFADYIKNLSSYIFTSFKEFSNQYDIEYELENMDLTIDTAVPLGLIINELLSNIVKYAFPGYDKTDTDNKVKISLKKSEHDKTLLIISDNGIGLPENFDIEKSNSLGLMIVSNLVRQIAGKLWVQPRNYTEFKIEFTNN